MTETPPKSALEIVMERLRQKDAASGEEQRQLSGEQKAAIAEVRQISEAKLAEREILFKSALARTFDPAERATLEDEYRRDVARFHEEREQKIEKIRRSLPNPES